MSELKGTCIFGQSGGPTTANNAIAAGVFHEAFSRKCITGVYGAAHGIRGILENQIYDISKEDPYEIELLKTTPSSALGSIRYKLKSTEEDESEYRKILDLFKRYNVRYFIYNGGNDSMDTCNKVSKYMQKVGYECRIMGVPKTIDNDIMGTDHCPGYGSAAKYIATSTMEIYHDAKVYDTGMITILEIMGRNAGWVTAAAALADQKGNGPDLIYLPEIPFDLDCFLEDTSNIYKENGNVIVAVSEGIRDKNGRFIAEMGSNLPQDAFGHVLLGGTAAVLASIAKNNIAKKVRAIEFSLLQRCAAHIASLTDINESYTAGRMAVRYAVEGITDYMIAFERTNDPAYECDIKLINLQDAANFEKKVPLKWINKHGNGITNDFIQYALPLIQGEVKVPFERGLPRYAKLMKIPV